MAETKGVVLKDREESLADAAGSTVGKKAFLVLETQGELYAVRWALVKEAGVILPREIDFLRTPPVVRRGGRDYQFHYLWQLIGLNRPKEEPVEIAAVFLEEKCDGMVVAPERILWKQEADLRELPQWLKKGPVVAGVIALQSGVAVVVVEPFAVSSTASKERRTD